MPEAVSESHPSAAVVTVVALGAFDTKGDEYAFLRDRLRMHGVDVLLVDVGVLGTPTLPAEIDRETVARAGGTELAELVQRRDRGAAVAAMARGAAVVVRELWDQGSLQGIIGLGGTGGSTLISQAMRELPVGVPKLLVSTVASGDTSPYVGATDLTMMHSVVDMAGINRLSEKVLRNAAAAIAAMATGAAEPEPASDRLLVGATMFGVTTPCVTRAKERLECYGYEVLVFHATGTGGEAMETLARGGFLAGVLDVTTTELADELVGGVFAARPGRLRTAGDLGLPQVVSVGALDMVNFGPRETVPEQFNGRNFYQHNATTTLMRTTPEECAELGRRLAQRVANARGGVTVFLPRRGVSLIDVKGEPFHDEAADNALFDAVETSLTGTPIRCQVLDTDINDSAFADAMADELHRLIAERSAQRVPQPAALQAAAERTQPTNKR